VKMSIVFVRIAFLGFVVASLLALLQKRTSTKIAVSREFKALSSEDHFWLQA